MVMMINKSE